MPKSVLKCIDSIRMRKKWVWSKANFLIFFHTHKTSPHLISHSYSFSHILTHSFSHTLTVSHCHSFTLTLTKPHLISQHLTTSGLTKISSSPIADHFSVIKARVSFSYCTVLHCTVLYCTVLYCYVLFCTIMHSVSLE